MKSELEIKQEMCEIGRRVYNRGMVAANDGNFSVKLSEDEYLCTPTGVSKGFMTPEYICKVNAKGGIIMRSRAIHRWNRKPLSLLRVFFVSFYLDSLTV